MTSRTGSHATKPRTRDRIRVGVASYDVGAAAVGRDAAEELAVADPKERPLQTDLCSRAGGQPQREGRSRVSPHGVTWSSRPVFHKK